MANKTIKELADALYGADIGINPDSEDYERLAEAIAPKLEEFFGVKIRESDEVKGTLTVWIPHMKRYKIPMKARSYNDAMGKASSFIADLKEELVFWDYLDNDPIEEDSAGHMEFEWQED